MAVCLASLPLALVARSIEPLLLALAISLPVQPFAFIDGTTFQSDRSFAFLGSLTKAFLFSICFAVISEWFSELIGGCCESAGADT